MAPYRMLETCRESVGAARRWGGGEGDYLSDRLIQGAVTRVGRGEGGGGGHV